MTYKIPKTKINVRIDPSDLYWIRTFYDGNVSSFVQEAVSRYIEELTCELNASPEDRELIQHIAETRKMLIKMINEKNEAILINQEIIEKLKGEISKIQTLWELWEVLETAITSQETINDDK